MYKWLPIIFGCHCKKERSFHYKGKAFPICARCTGELVGMIFSLFFSFFQRPSVLVCILCMIPMVIDGFVQMLTQYESNNRRRFITGCLFGYGFLMFFIVTIIMTFQFGLNLGIELSNR